MFCLLQRRFHFADVLHRTIDAHDTALHCDRPANPTDPFLLAVWRLQFCLKRKRLLSFHSLFYMLLQRFKAEVFK